MGGNPAAACDRLVDNRNDAPIVQGCDLAYARSLLCGRHQLAHVLLRIIGKKGVGRDTVIEKFTEGAAGFYDIWR